MAKKFIICDAGIVMGNVGYHFELARGQYNVVGGGRWEFDEANKILFLYSSSIDYGHVSKEEVEKAIKESKISDRYKNCRVLFSHLNEYEEVVQAHYKETEFVTEIKIK